MTTADGSVIGTAQISGSAPRNRAFNIVMLGDGFQASEQAVLNTACASFVTALLGEAPFNELGPAINVFRVNVASTDSGADDPASAGGTGATARTYFDATFGAGGLQRRLVCNESTVLTVAAAQVPEFSVAILVVNSTIYGGSGGSVATYSLSGGANEIALHELGHTTFRLADEYVEGSTQYPPYEPPEPNVTVNTNRATLKWRWAVAAATPIPTMSNPDCSTADPRPSPVPSGTVGEFEGARYYHCGIYRPEHDCKMNHLDVPFCAVCRSVIRNRIAPLLGGGLTARTRTPLSVVARYPEHLDVFAVAADGRTVSNWWDASTGWAGWSHISGGVASAGGPGSPVTVVSRFAGHMDVFTVGTDNHVYTASWDESAGWAPWVPLGNLNARPGSTVNAVSRYTGHLDLFTIGTDGRVMSCSWDQATGWSGWFNVSGGVAAAGAQVTAISRYPSHLDLFVVGTDNKVRSCWWDEKTGWAHWFLVRSQLAKPDSTVNVVARHRDQMDLFTTDPSGRVISTWWNNSSGWGTWFQVKGGIASPGSQVTAIARAWNHLDLFKVGTDNRIYSTWWHDTSGWAPWFVISGGDASPGSTVTAISRINDHIDVFAVGPDSKVHSCSWHKGTGWAAWFPLAVS